jgi:uncharacterized protein YcaQ
MIRSAFLEQGQDARRIAVEVASELRRMQSWLGLDGLEVNDCGDLAAVLDRALL